jgi:hypothetical protein
MGVQSTVLCTSSIEAQNEFGDAWRGTMCEECGDWESAG